MKKRNEYLRKKYDVIDSKTSTLNPELELKRFEWLRKLGVINEDRLKEAQNHFDINKKEKVGF